MTASPRIVLRCNAGGRTGLGHLSRCLNLAGALAERGARCTFVLPREAAALTGRVRDSGHDVALIDTSTRRSDLAALRERLDATPCDWLIVDHYETDSGYLAGLADQVPRLAVLDDVGDRDLGRVGLVVNPSPGAAQWTSTGPQTTLLSGPQFALLDPAFGRARDRFEVRSELRHVALYLGGACTPSLWSSVHTALRDAFPHARTTLLTTPDAAPLDTQTPAVEVRRGLPPAEVATLFANADLAVVPTSTMAWEVCCIGVPTVFVPLVDNQRRVASYLTEALGTVAAPSELAALFDARPWRERTSREDASRRQRALTDGCGAQRVAARMLDALRD